MKTAVLAGLAVLLFIAPCFSVQPHPALITLFWEHTPTKLHFVMAFDTNSRPIEISDGNVRLVKLKRGRFVTVKVLPGRHVISIKHGESITIHVRPGDHLFFEPTFASWVKGSFRLVEMSCPDASSILRDLKMSDPKSILVSHEAVESSYLFKSDCDPTGTAGAVPAQTSSN